MSTEKLSELSKPVAWDFPGSKEESRQLGYDFELDDEQKVNCSALYSQEYVSALRTDAAKWFEAFQKAVSIGARHEERIAELEDAEQKLCAANVTLDARASAAEAKLATPVRLPKPCAFNLCDLVDRDAVIASLREQGLTVEGDEYP